MKKWIVCLVDRERPDGFDVEVLATDKDDARTKALDRNPGAEWFFTIEIS